MAQHWNNVLGYIKREMGAKLNFLEMTEEEIIEGLKDDILPYFSQYIPRKNFAYVTSATQIIPTAGQNQWVYKIETEDRIIDILDAFASDRSDTLIFDEFGNSVINSGSMIDLAIANVYTDIAKYLQTRNTWEFLQPNLISWDEEIQMCIVIYNTVHHAPDTIRSDYYHTTFKKLCLGNVQKWVAALRSKYESLQTPFGEIRVNWQKLETDSEKNIQEAQQNLDTAPLDKFVEVSI